MDPEHPSAPPSPTPDPPARMPTLPRAPAISASSLQWQPEAADDSPRAVAWRARRAMRVADRNERSIGRPASVDGEGRPTQPSGLWAYVEETVGRPPGIDKHGHPTPPTGLWAYVHGLREEIATYQTETARTLTDIKHEVDKLVLRAKAIDNAVVERKSWLGKRLEHVADWLLPILIGGGAVWVWQHYH